MFATEALASCNVTLEFCFQAVALFPTALDASRFYREYKQLDESKKSTIIAVQQMAQGYGVKLEDNLKMDIVRENASCLMLAVNNVFMVPTMQLGGASDANAFEMIGFAAKTIARLNRQLVHYRSDCPLNLAMAPSVLPPDPDMCAYCGKGGSPNLHVCARCKTFWYCSGDCLTKHWKMDGHFGHKRECKLMTDRSVTKPAISLGWLVMIDGLKSAAGQRMNGKDAIVVTPPTDQGRLGVVLVDDVSKDQEERLKRGDVSWVPTERKNSIKAENLDMVWTEFSENKSGRP